MNMHQNDIHDPLSLGEETNNLKIVIKDGSVISNYEIDNDEPDKIMIKDGSVISNFEMDNGEPDKIMIKDGSVISNYEMDNDEPDKILIKDGSVISNYEMDNDETDLQKDTESTLSTNKKPPDDIASVDAEEAMQPNNDDCIDIKPNISAFTNGFSPVNEFNSDVNLGENNFSNLPHLSTQPADIEMKEEPLCDDFGNLEDSIVKTEEACEEDPLDSLAVTTSIGKQITKTKKADVIDVEMDNPAESLADVIPLGPDKPIDPLHIESQDMSEDDDDIKVEYKSLNKSTSLLPSKKVCQRGKKQNVTIIDDDDDDVIPLKDVDPLGDIGGAPNEITTDVADLIKSPRKKRMKVANADAPKKTYVCDKCEYTSLQRHRLVRHYRKHTGEKPYQCNLCDYKATQSCSLKKHKLKHEAGNHIFKCGECNYATLYRVTFANHINEHKTTEVLQCALCTYSTYFLTNYEIHLREHDNNPPFQCPKCSFISEENMSNLLTHMTIHRMDEEQYVCQFCPYSANSKSSLSKHKHTVHPEFVERSEQRERPEKQIVGPSADHNSMEKPHKCPICPYSAMYKNNLSSHMVKHTGEKKYQCKFCPFKGLYRSSLQKHMKKNHPVDSPINNIFQNSNGLLMSELGAHNPLTNVHFTPILPKLPKRLSHGKSSNEMPPNPFLLQHSLFGMMPNLAAGMESFQDPSHNGYLNSLNGLYSSPYNSSSHSDNDLSTLLNANNLSVQEMLQQQHLRNVLSANLSNQMNPGSSVLLQLLQQQKLQELLHKNESKKPLPESDAIAFMQNQIFNNEIESNAMREALSRSAIFNDKPKIKTENDTGLFSQLLLSDNPSSESMSMSSHSIQHNPKLLQNIKPEKDVDSNKDDLLSIFSSPIKSPNDAAFANKRSSMANLLARLAASAAAKSKEQENSKELVDNDVTNSDELIENSVAKAAPSELEKMSVLGVLSKLNPELSVNESEVSNGVAHKEKKSERSFDPLSSLKDDTPSISIYPCSSKSDDSSRNVASNDINELTMQQKKFIESRLASSTSSMADSASLNAASFLPIQSALLSQSKNTQLDDPAASINASQLTALLLLQRQQQMALQSMFGSNNPFL